MYERRTVLQVKLICLVSYIFKLAITSARDAQNSKSQPMEIDPVVVRNIYHNPNQTILQNIKNSGYELTSVDACLSN